MNKPPMSYVCNEKYCNTRLKFRRFWVKPVIQKTFQPKTATCIAARVCQVSVKPCLDPLFYDRTGAFFFFSGGIVRIPRKGTAMQREKIKEGLAKGKNSHVNDDYSRHWPQKQPELLS